MKKGREGEQGILLLDLAISLPAIIFLMGTIAFVSVFTVREGYRIYAEAELRQEVQDVMMRITGDAAEAYKVQKVYMSRGVGIKIWKRPIRLETPSVSKEKDKRGDVLYFTHEVGSLTKICYGDPHQPITGNSSFARVQIVAFDVEDYPAEKKHVVTIKARNPASKATYTLTRVIYVSKEGEFSRDAMGAAKPANAKTIASAR